MKSVFGCDACSRLLGFGELHAAQSPEQQLLASPMKRA